jgi:hypothetical protein
MQKNYKKNTVGLFYLFLIFNFIILFYKGDFNKLIDDQMKKIDYILGQFDDSECSAWDLIGFTIGYKCFA